MKKYLIFVLMPLLISCNGPKNETKESVQAVKQVNVPIFSADSAYKYIQNQVDFGPRVPNSKAHQLCSAYLESQLKAFGADVILQKAKLTAFNGDKLNAVNIIGSFQPEKKNRIVLFSHWDSRPWADHDPDATKRKMPVPAANDGASGVGVMLEIARQLSAQKANVGIDLIFVDAEDYGAPEGTPGNTEDSWALGSQYWANNPHVPGYKADFGILLDMVGGVNATFYREVISENYASSIVDKVWSTAANLGFSSVFVPEQGGGVTDDHLYINKIAGIPTIDIIQYDMKGGTGFAEYWHTTGDDMSQVDKNTLYAVGTTLMHVIYNE